MPRYIHHNPDLWRDPFHFDPTRFIDPQTNDVFGSKSTVLRNLLSFSRGPRACLGGPLAMARFFLMVTNLVQNFTMEPRSSDAHDLSSCDPRNVELGLVSRPPSYSVRFIARS
ncbi:hypothetical protein HELRODRAFT_178375 [Helobdella robusta]|uniref:Cytochrome P450 n=1 Tax=Helobdella robusta TaxID=6412 RepID=T1FD39_HELRO|nr:hypothetical protein HELRODRAFT_178375 [Helobdella robusta]ESN97252.1 hypothetical protein HELRODRAFT_178375 [Helobdella robusta]